MKFCWHPGQTDARINQLLGELALDYPLARQDQAPAGSPLLVFQPTAEPGTVQVTRQAGGFLIRYDTLARAARGVGAVLGGLVPDGAGHQERCPFETFGIMLDCSRNAVVRPDHFKLWLRRLALLGYNTAMLYTEETYEIPGEDYFGYLRGRFTAAELKGINDYARLLGIEMIGCIQTLGHLEQMLKWSHYRPLKDTDSVLLADDEATYRFIGRMLDVYVQAFGSRRIHIGMDETHDLGRGRFMDLYGAKRGFDIFNRHLDRVRALCAERGLSPMIWSDMYFRMGSKTGDYYDLASVVPDDVREAIPRGVQLVYWDYYGTSLAHYREWIKRHHDLKVPMMMGSAVWSWFGFWYNRAFTERTMKPCLEASRELGVKELIFTMWGDDGACCDFDSALAGLAFGAEHAYGGNTLDEARLARRFEAVCGVSYELVTLAAELSWAESDPPSVLEATEFSATVLWDDPLLGICWKNRTAAHWDAFLARCRKVEEGLSAAPRHDGVIDLDHAYRLARVFQTKVQIAIQFNAAYAARSREGLAAVQAMIPEMRQRIDDVLVSFRRQWFRRNKPHGFETIQLRLGGLKERFTELDRRIAEWLDGTYPTIPELEERPKTPLTHIHLWKKVASAGQT